MPLDGSNGSFMLLTVQEAQLRCPGKQQGRKTRNQSSEESTLGTAQKTLASPLRSSEHGASPSKIEYDANPPASLLSKVSSNAKTSFNNAEKSTVEKESGTRDALLREKVNLWRDF